MIYLATPYSHPDPAVREQRFQTVNREAARLMGLGMQVFSPISHSHPIAQAGSLPTDWAFWEEYDRTMLQACSTLVVLRAQGWQESSGVKAEMEIAKELRIPIMFHDPK
jgi:hypothetical protein